MEILMIIVIGIILPIYILTSIYNRCIMDSFKTYSHCVVCCKNYTLENSKNVETTIDDESYTLRKFICLDCCGKIMDGDIEDHRVVEVAKIFHIHKDALLESINNMEQT